MLALGLALLGAGPARADLRLCNQTESKVGVSLGYRDTQGWVTEGWWELKPKGCETLLSGSLAARFYYVFAVDYTRGGEWGGRSLMCTRDAEFTIRGIERTASRVATMTTGRISSASVMPATRIVLPSSSP